MNREEKAKLLREWILRSTTAAESGHPTSCLSSVDIMTVLFDKYYTYDLEHIDNLNNDRFILSKGHAAPLLYALYAVAGAYPLENLLTLRQINSPFEGHPTPNFTYAEAATGSLGQGISIGSGMALGLSKMTDLGRTPKVFVLLGDGEMAEGQNWEAANFASYYKLKNIIAIVDVNRFGQSQETMFGIDTNAYATRLESFGWSTITIDGHNFQEIDDAFEKALNNSSDKPMAIIARTIKGKGISFLENKLEWHGKPLPEDKLQEALKELGTIDESVRFSIKKPEKLILLDNKTSRIPVCTYEKGTEIATREVYGHILSECMQADQRIYALDGDLKNSTFSSIAFNDVPERSIECFIAEQNMVSVAVGLARLGLKPAVSTFGSFLTRALDQIRMANLSRSSISFCGSHSGVSMGQDGPSQMGLEDISIFSDLPGSIVVHPSDAVSAARLLPQVLMHNGITYFRTLRTKTPVIYENNEEFHIGGSKLLISSPSDVLTIAATGITVHEALKAQKLLAADNIHVRIIDCYSIKPIDKDGILAAATTTQKPIVISVEDHYKHGGLSDAILEAVDGYDIDVVTMAVTKTPHSGKIEDTLKFAGIDASSIVAKVKSFI